jgi:hypothetical protein
MTLWHRAPRSVYQVYDEEQYLSGADVPDGEETGPGHESQAPASGIGQIDPECPQDLGEMTGEHTRRERDGLAERSRQRSLGRMLALSLLCVVTASVACLVAFAVSRHSAATPPVHRALARPLRSVVSGSNVPMSKMSASSVSASAVSVYPSPDRRAVVKPVELERVASGPMVVPPRRVGTSARPVAGPPPAPIERLGEVADVARWHATESLPTTTESQIDDEFGFER